MVERGVLDLAFTILPVRDGLFASEQLFADPYLLVVPAGHALARQQSAPSFEQIRELDLVAYRTCRANAQVERFLRSHGVEPRIVLRAEDNLLIQGLVAEGLGAALMPLLAVDLERSDTTALTLVGQVPPRRTGLVWHRDRYRTPSALAFADLAREAAATLGDITTSAQPTVDNDLPEPVAVARQPLRDRP
jgi:DNA-binding transcriptional LysR family regulator